MAIDPRIPLRDFCGRGSIFSYILKTDFVKFYIVINQIIQEIKLLPVMLGT
jgi:hypothetical protein